MYVAFYMIFVNVLYLSEQSAIKEDTRNCNKLTILSCFVFKFITFLKSSPWERYSAVKPVKI